MNNHFEAYGLEREGSTKREPARIGLGDISNDDGVVSRWVRLSHPSGTQFAMSGESTPEGIEGPIYYWNAMTLVLRSVDGCPESALWVTNCDDMMSAQSSLLSQSVRTGRAYDEFADSIRRSILRTVPESAKK